MVDVLDGLQSGVTPAFESMRSARNARHCLVIDLVPESGGVVGQVVLFSTQSPELIVLVYDFGSLHDLRLGQQRL